MEVGRGGEIWQGFRALSFVSSPVPASVPCVGFGPMLHLCFQPGLWLHLLLFLIGLWLDLGPDSSLATSRVVDGPCHPAPSLPATFRHCGTAPRCWVTLAGTPQPGPAAPRQISPWVETPQLLGQLVPVLSQFHPDNLFPYVYSVFLLLQLVIVACCHFAVYL